MSVKAFLGNNSFSLRIDLKIGEKEGGGVSC